MKKMFIIFIFLIFIFQGCTFFETDNQVDANEHLTDQFENYRDKDILDQKTYHQFVNQLSLETSLASVALKIEIYDSVGSLQEIRIGSGVIFYSDALYYHVMTSYEMGYVSNRLYASYEITDVFGNLYHGALQNYSKELGLSSIVFGKVQQQRLDFLRISSYDPFIGEPVLLLGFQYGVINMKTQGFIIHKINDKNAHSKYLLSNIPSDENGTGAALVNMRNELVGIQLGILDDVVYFVGHDTVSKFFRFYIDSLTQID